MKRCGGRAYNALRTMGACSHGLRLVKRHGWKKAWDLADDEDAHWVWEQLAAYYPAWDCELDEYAEDFRRRGPIPSIKDVFRRPTVAELEWCARQIRKEKRRPS